MVKRLKATRLLNSIATKNWYDINRYLNEANLPDRTNTYALHQICGDSTAPLKIVTDIYYAYPMAALAKNSHQDTPILIAVEAGFEDAVQFLAKACPEACAICDSLGSTPILSVVFSLNYNTMIDSMVIANPDAAFIANDEGNSAFDYFFWHWNVFMRIVVHNPTICDQILDCLIGHGNWKIRDIYQKACLFLKAAYHHRRGKVLDDSYLLHCSLREETCHWAFSKLLMTLHPEQILRRDIDGNLPFQIITASSETCDENTFFCYDCFRKGNKLVYAEFINGDSKYCCQNCIERESKQSINKSFFIRPGT